LPDILALYRGRTVGEARLVAVTVEPAIVDRFFAELGYPGEGAEKRDAEEGRELRLVPGGGDD
jgi:hypothetical protein